MFSQDGKGLLEGDQRELQRSLGVRKGSKERWKMGTESAPTSAWRSPILLSSAAVPSVNSGRIKKKEAATAPNGAHGGIGLVVGR